MRRIVFRIARVLGLVVSLALVYYVLACTAIFSGMKAEGCVPDSACLTKTHWQQMGGFEQDMPDRNRIGCWGTALAQLVYYYHLQPYGRVAYRSTRGISVDEDLGAYRFDFSRFGSGIDSTTPRANREALAKYSYCAALVVRKDFGTGSNMQALSSPGDWEAHYPVKVSRYISWHGVLPYTRGKLGLVIVSELLQKRPVYLHFANLKDMGHSAVVDGYCYRDGVLYLHMNQGQGGPTDGWYEWPKGILREDDGALRVVYTVRLVY